MTVQNYIDKINQIAEFKTNIEEMKKQEEEKAKEKYLKQIKKLSKRVADLVKLGNVLAEKRIPNTEYTRQLLHDLMEVVKANSLNMKFENSTGRYKEDPTYDSIALSIKKEGHSWDTLIVVSTDGTVKKQIQYSSGSRSDDTNNLKSSELLKFIETFEKFEQVTHQYIEEL